MSAVRVLPVGAPFPAIVIEQPKQEYVVKSGDTVAAIAKKFSVTPADLMKENKITDARKLKAGQKLTISVPGKPLGSGVADVSGAPQAAAPAPKAGEVKPFAPDGKAEAKPDVKPDAKADAKATDEPGKKAATEPATAPATPPSPATAPRGTTTAERACAAPRRAT